MALADGTNRRIRTRMLAALRVANGDTVYNGSYVGLQGEDDATAGDHGHGTVWDDVAGRIPMGGFALREVVGDTTATPPPELEVSIDGGVVENVAVTGADGINDVGRPVYMSDDDTFTLTRPTLGLAIGVIVRHLTGTSCDVYLLGFGELLALAMGGCAQETICLGSYDLSVVNPNEPGGATVDLLTGWKAPYHGAIVDFYSRTDIATVEASGGGYVLSLEIGGVDVTGGALTILGGSAIGTVTSATAITALNVFHEGGTLDVQAIAANSGDDLTAGRVDLFIEVEKKPGL